MLRRRKALAVGAAPASNRQSMRSCTLFCVAMHHLDEFALDADHDLGVRAVRYRHSIGVAVEGVHNRGDSRAQLPLGRLRN